MVKTENLGAAAPGQDRMWPFGIIGGSDAILSDRSLGSSMIGLKSKVQGIESGLTATQVPRGTGPPSRRPLKYMKRNIGFPCVCVY